MSFECGQQRVMRLGWERPRSPVARPVLTNRMRYVAKEKMWRRGRETPLLLGFPDFLRHILF